MRKYKKSGILKNKSFNIVSRFFLSSFVVISFFYVTPIFINFADKNFNNKEFTNNSKNILNNTLNQDKLIDEDSTAEADERDLLYDILEENNSEINLVRYTTSEIDSLFKEVNYNLKDVRDTKLVKPIDIGLLPNEIKNIANTKKRKDMFIKIVLPLIVKENNKIRVDRKRLFIILNKNSNTDIEKKWLEKKYKQYGVRKNDLSTLKVRMDEIPVSLAIAQAAKETGWGTSRFALKGNALFGQWTWSCLLYTSPSPRDATHLVCRLLLEKKWLEKKYKQYGVRKNDLSTLKVRMDEIPVSYTHLTLPTSDLV